MRRMQYVSVRAAFATGAFALVSAALSSPASATETIQYVYDARGRLVEVVRTQPTVVVKSKYTYDRADNRTKKEVTTVP